MADHFVIDRSVFLNAARVTVGFACVYLLAIFYQGFYNLALKLQCIKKKERYDRYSDPRMRIRDRVVGNLLEWSLPFLSLFWVSMLLTNGSTLWLGWVYVAARALYPIMAVNGGLGQIGPKTPILISTVPGYLSLFGLLVAAVMSVL